MLTPNGQKALDGILATIDPKHPPRLLLHGCCAPCSSYVIEYLSRYFAITIHYYNPNIFSREEYEKRAEELARLLREMPLAHPVSLTVPTWDHAVFLQMARGLEQVPEGGERCFRCYEMRLTAAAEEAARGGFDYFATTLTVSPLKNAEKINELGESIAQKWGVSYLPSDFKKRGGYLRTIELSRTYGLYRQDFCGCEFSYAARHPSDTTPVTHTGKERP